MKLSTGKRIGQSGQELLTAAVFSFVLHACTIAAVALFYISASPRVFSPPSYQVKLVGGPAAAPQAAPSPQAAPAPKAPASAPHRPKPAPRAKQAPKQQHKAPALPARSAMPELSKAKPKPEKHEPERIAEQPHEQASAPAVAPAGAARGSASTGVKSESGAVTTSGGPQDFNQKFEWYLRNVSDKIGQNWKPTPDAPDARVRVTFTLNRSGWAGGVNIVEAETKATYGFKLAAMRAIQMSSPFPQLPDDFGRQTLELTVDLKAQE